MNLLQCKHVCFTAACISTRTQALYRVHNCWFSHYTLKKMCPFYEYIPFLEANLENLDWLIILSLEHSVHWLFLFEWRKGIQPQQYPTVYFLGPASSETTPAKTKAKSITAALRDELCKQLITSPPVCCHTTLWNVKNKIQKKWTQNGQHFYGLWRLLKFQSTLHVCDTSRKSPGCGSTGMTWKKYLYRSSPASVAGFSRLPGYGDNFSRVIITRPARIAYNVRSRATAT